MKNNIYLAQDEKEIMEKIKEFGAERYSDGLGSINNAIKKAFRTWYKENNIGNDPTGAWEEIEAIALNDL